MNGFIPAKQHRGRRLTAFISFVFAISSVTWVAMVTSKVLAPTPGTGRHADAVISLAPGNSRLPTALYLYAQGNADELVISWFPSRMSQEVVEPERGWLGDQVCSKDSYDDIHCFTPAIDSTYGEALSVKELVSEQRWQSITVVTSRYHAFRAKFIFKRVLPPDVDVEVVVSPTKLSVQDWVRHIIYENAAFVKAVFETAFE
ncbi:YdcF family protein [Glutamicibacter sp. BSL13]